MTGAELYCAYQPSAFNFAEQSCGTCPGADVCSAESSESSTTVIIVVVVLILTIIILVVCISQTRAKHANQSGLASLGTPTHGRGRGDHGHDQGSELEQVVPNVVNTAFWDPDPGSTAAPGYQSYVPPPCPAHHDVNVLVNATDGARQSPMHAQPAPRPAAMAQVPQTPPIASAPPATFDPNNPNSPTLLRRGVMLPPPPSYDTVVMGGRAGGVPSSPSLGPGSDVEV